MIWASVRNPVLVIDEHVELLFPPVHLAGEEPLRPAEIRQPHSSRVDRVQRGEGVHEAGRNRPGPFGSGASSAAVRYRVPSTCSIT